MLLQCGVLALVGLIVSLALQETWAAFAALSLVGWSVLGVFAFGVMLLGNVLQVVAIRSLGSAVVSSMLALRLVAALVLSAVLLGEPVFGVVQIGGASLVVLAITVYLYGLRPRPEPAQPDAAHGHA